MSGVPRHLVVAALDALEIGDQAEAAVILLDALEESPNPAHVTDLPPICGVCGVRAWPGEGWRHIHSAHHPLERAA